MSKRSRHNRRPVRHAAPTVRAAAVIPVSTVERGYASDWLTGWPEEHETTPELRWPVSIEVYDRMRRQDAQVISVLRAVTQPIRGAAWRIDPNGARDEVTRFVADNFGLPLLGEDYEARPRLRDRFDFGEHLRLALLMLPFGHSYFEQVYRIDDVGMARLRKLGWRPPRTISRIEVASDGGLIAIEQHAIDGQTHRMEVSRLVAYINEREGGNWLGMSLLRPAYKDWLLKDRLLRVQAQTVDRNGMGVPVYTGSQVSTTLSTEEQLRRAKEELDAGHKLARGFRSGDSAGASIPYGAKMELLGVEGTLPNADPPIRYHDEQMARAVLAHFLNLGTETGSWALGSTFADFFVQSLRAVAQVIADIFTAHVIEDLVDANWGPDEPAPRLVFGTISSQQAATAASIKALIDCRALIADDSLESWIRSSFGLPAADPGTAREAPSTPPPPDDTGDGDTTGDQTDENAPGPEPASSTAPAVVPTRRGKRRRSRR